MKSIKEKAIEVFPEHCNFYTNSCNERKRIGFEAGANYVLDIIEQCLTPQKCFTEHGIDICVEALVKTALQTIEQLKK